MLTYTSIRPITNVHLWQILSSCSDRNYQQKTFGLITDGANENGQDVHLSDNKHRDEKKLKDHTNAINNVCDAFTNNISSGKEDVYNDEIEVGNNNSVNLRGDPTDSHDDCHADNHRIPENHANYMPRKTFFIGEVSVIVDLLSSLVDLLTALLFSRAMKYIKQKFYFYILLSSVHLFFSYKELQHLLMYESKI
ncbi:hypothetical protein MKS88_003747 [Plasmodium brasilianum]|uniref:Uncharacterized protein n=3 Tax=Plasmodium (Plasmodium) TaxID=418103 RepID=A0A1A8W2J0_PLAMA|nr:hypothetical protein MKS88_003747 [Plasmodium brasilianum]SBS87136.1 conserved Plasmodium protein, unknown function [Plasmodium malariae]